MARKKKTNSKPEAEEPKLPSSEVEETTLAPIVESVPGPELMAAEPGFPIVGIGASAGGLLAFEKFFSAMPAGTESGMAFVLVQHLSPDHKSILTDLVKRYTPMQVFEVEDGMEVKPNCAYIIPPNHDMAILNGKLQLLEPTAPRGIRMPIDFFFRSMAQDQRERAICIVLSGTGSDGTLGLRAVKGEGGLVIVQEPDSTQYAGMPSSAIATGLADAVLPPEEMPSRLIAYVARAFAKRLAPAAPPVPSVDDMLQKICILLRAQTGHDFSRYKQNTLVRRVDRRMALLQIERMDDYLRYLQKDAQEAQALFRDLLIGVTNFFRDPEAFKALETQVIPRLFANKPVGSDIRVWVCGCATGEEAYSIAMLIQEQLENLRQTYRVQIFATDIDRQAIETARSGLYPASIATDISAERLARFFSLDTESGSYRIQKAIRDLLIFSEQDVIKDPPFSKLDLISCRNLLIYLDSELQRKLIPLFHYALNQGGMLFLGASETLGEFVSIFRALDRKWKIYERQEDISGSLRMTLGEFVPPLTEGARPRRRPDEGRSGEGRINLQDLTQRSLLAHYDTVGILVNGRGEILYIHGRTGKYLEPAPGDAGMN
ncbi:MAG TPA: chemotaxis protein CheB, partial [Anaerolineales bacterium]|nr:chemotaxis protein CheB [Anaerolineales bacterium]